MTWTDAFTELNASIGDYFGQLISYAPADGGSIVSGITANVDITQEYGMAHMDIPAASVALPLIGSLITLADTTEWRIYDAGANAYGYSPCEIRSADNWQVVSLQHYTYGDWELHTAGLPMFIDTTNVEEVYNPETVETNTFFNGRCMYLGALNQRMRVLFGTRELYVTQVLPDPTNSRYLDIVLQEEVRPWQLKK